MPSAEQIQQKREAAREVIDILQEIAFLLVKLLTQQAHCYEAYSDSNVQNTNLNRTQLSISISLIENGVNPEALAVCLLMIRSEEQSGEI